MVSFPVPSVSNYLLPFSLTISLAITAVISDKYHTIDIQIKCTVYILLLKRVNVLANMLKKNNLTSDFVSNFVSVAYPGIFCRGVQQIQLRTEDKQNGDLGAVAPKSGVLEAVVIWYKKFHFI